MNFGYGFRKIWSEPDLLTCVNENPPKLSVCVCVCGERDIIKPINGELLYDNMRKMLKLSWKSTYISTLVSEKNKFNSH